MAVGDTSATGSLGTWTELSGFQQLRAQAQGDGGKAALPAVARQFESIFTQMMLKSMRDASPGDGMGDSEQGNAYRDLFDHQLSLSLSNSGHGIGIAQMLMRQLGGKDSSAAAGVDASSPSAWRDTLEQLSRSAASAASKVSQFVPGSGDAVSFVQALAPHAQAAAEKLGVSVRALLAQAALETGWGKHLPSHGDGSTSNNLFGMKAGSSWDGDKVSVPTLEYENGVAVRKRDQFRAYQSPGDSFQDYAQVIANNPRYSSALGRGEDIRGFAHALARGGYATDPGYAKKLESIANSPEMKQALASLKSVDALPSQLP
ncbi:flagellar protein FlgJ [Dyella sp. OK004]|uniref:flagellar assembly peptidoglycan hydrolase FlgJ n=1 Tax=Dyella sp. OK004 TaxID=1855292 RepID=UPI0008EB69BC|nr:flagellar assembly peptidoglycan hydrolase FlgJ [Dyella sp. OK004]SFR87071.1 flagellar protein FlgJ [Dyella sp. OK004]